VELDKEVGLREMLGWRKAFTVRFTGIVCGVLPAPGSLTVIVAENAPEDKEEVK